MMNLDDGDDHHHLYGLLGVSSKATTREIRLAYHRQSLLYHPDKLQDAQTTTTSSSSSLSAQKIFHRIHTAYTELRSIYDTHGMAGVHARMQVGPILRELEAQDAQSKHWLRGWSGKSRLIAHVDAKEWVSGEYSDQLTLFDRLPGVTGLATSWMAAKSLQQQSMASMATMRLGYSVSMQQGQGGGWCMAGCSWKPFGWLFRRSPPQAPSPSPSQAQAQSSLLSNRYLFWLDAVRVDVGLFGGTTRRGLTTTLHYHNEQRGWAGSGGLDVLVQGGRLYPTAKTTILGRFGDYGSLVGSLERSFGGYDGESSNTNANTNTNASIAYISPETLTFPFSLNLTIPLQFESSWLSVLEFKCKWPIDRMNRLKMRCSTDGAISVGLVKRWSLDGGNEGGNEGTNDTDDTDGADDSDDNNDKNTKNTKDNKDTNDYEDTDDTFKTGIFVEVSMTEGCTLQLHLAYSTWSVVIPIGIADTEHLSTHSILMAAALPLGASILGGLIMGILGRKGNGSHRDDQLDHDYRARLREDALAIQEVMRGVLEAQKVESLLLITRATYSGNLDTLDVTIPLQAIQYRVLQRDTSFAKVIDDTLDDAATVLIEGGRSKAGLLGFYNISGRAGANGRHRGRGGGDRKLTVWYRFRGREHRAVVGDLEELAIPQKKHLL